MITTDHTRVTPEAAMEIHRTQEVAMVDLLVTRATAALVHQAAAEAILAAAEAILAEATQVAATSPLAMRSLRLRTASTPTVMEVATNEGLQRHPRSHIEKRCPRTTQVI